MDQEKTMQFILYNLASVTARLEIVGERAEALTARDEALAARIEALAKRQDKTDRQIRGLQALTRTGMKIIVKLADGQIALQKDLKELVVAQKRTEQRFDRWLDSLKSGSNGHKKR